MAETERPWVWKMQSSFSLIPVLHYPSLGWFLCVASTPIWLHRLYPGLFHLWWGLWLLSTLSSAVSKESGQQEGSWSEHQATGMESAANIGLLDSDPSGPASLSGGENEDRLADSERSFELVTLWGHLVLPPLPLSHAPASFSCPC